MHQSDIEVVNGVFHHGKYQFTDITSDGLDYRELRLNKRVIKVYHSGYMYSARCYRQFFSSNKIANDSVLRMYIYWHEQNYSFKQQVHKLRTPCILKIEELVTDNDTPSRLI